MATLDVLTQTGELISLLLVALTFGVLLAAAVKTRSSRSFQSQMVLFAAALFVAEVTQILRTLGVIDVSAFEDVGLEIHSGSMVVLVGFAFYRIYGFLREG